jgi:ribosomal protein S18 acetylase RimI-like enzyme
MDLLCRLFQKDDLSTICTFPQNAEELFFMFPKASFPLCEEELSAAIAGRADSTVVELDGAPVGFANFYRFEPRGRCSIGNVIVSPSVRRRGVATRLIRHMLGLAYGKYDAAEVTVACFNANAAALLLYPKLGFAPFAIEERFDPRGQRVALIHFKHDGAATWTPA